MAQLTPEQFAAKLREKAKAIALNAPLQIAAQSVHADRVIRIFSDGISGASYNKTDALYVADKDLRRAGTHKGKTGKQIKTTYYPSYYDLKQQQGFDPNTVNMRLTNDLQSDFANSEKITSGTGRPDIGDVQKINNDLYVESIKREHNKGKLKGGIKRFGNFVAFTQKEKDDFQRIYAFEMTKLLQS
jgi:hypothetical protein